MGGGHMRDDEPRARVPFTQLFYVRAMDYTREICFVVPARTVKSTYRRRAKGVSTGRCLQSARSQGCTL